MAKRNHIWVTFDQDKSKWNVKREGIDTPVSSHQSKETAVDKGRGIAKREGGELIIKGKNQLIQDKDSYGNDPNPPKDTKH